MSQNSPTLLPSRETGASPSCLDNITGFRVKFLPEGKKDNATGKITRTWVDGLKVQKATGFVKA